MLLQSQPSSSSLPKKSIGSPDKLENNQVKLSDTHKLLDLMYRFTKKTNAVVSPLEVLRLVRNDRLAMLASFLGGVPMAYIVLEPHKQEVCILQAYSISTVCTKSLWKYTSKWAKREGFDSIYAYVNRHPKAWERLFGLKVIGYKVGKELMSNGQ